MLHVSGHLRRALAAAVTTGAILGAGQVAAAQAAPTFSVSYAPLTSAVVGPSPTIWLTKPGQPSVTLTCPTLKPPGGFITNSPSAYWAGASLAGGTCTGSNGSSYNVSVSTPNQMYLTVAGGNFAVTATQPTTFKLSGGPNPPGGEGTATIAAHTMAWTNGNVSTPSRVSLSNYLLGTTGSIYPWQNNWTARISGQWNVTTSGGGLITALP